MQQPPLLLATLLGLSLATQVQAQAPPAQAQQAQAPSIAAFGKPILFSYGTWDKARVEGGRLILSAPDSKGGLGDNLRDGATLSLAAQSEMSPVIGLKVGANNKSKMLRLQLGDASGHNATWNFSLENLQPGQQVLVAAQDGASLATPASIAPEGRPDLGKILQWQLQGDYSAEPIDLEVTSIALAAPDAATLAARAAQAAKLIEEAQARARENQALKQKYLPGSAASPIVEHASLVASDVIALDIQAGRIVPAKHEKYVARPGDEKIEKKGGDGNIESVVLKRGGLEVGLLVGPKRDWLTTNERGEGDPLLLFEADLAANYAVTSPGDAAFKTPVQPIGLSRKSKPNGWAQGVNTLAVRHVLYLKMPRALQPGQRYTIRLGALNTKSPSVELSTNASRTRSEAVHVNQIGYRPDDPAKRAFVSCWMGTGGALKLPDTLRFSLVDDKTGKVAFASTCSDIWRADKPELMARDANFNGTDVARLDFSAFNKPGRYRVAVEGVGCSYAFEIGPNVWKRAFTTQMRGLLHQRTGMALGAPYTSYTKPRDMHPADGYRVTRTKYRAIEAGGEAWAQIPAGDTGQPAPGWGGYHDAGDWNPRRVTHMKATLAQLEALEMFPKYFQALKLGIPPTPGLAKGTPDIIAEAVWEFECFRRLQLPDGGVGLGLESRADPLGGEVSWLNSFPSYAFAPDYNASWFYASVGARLSLALQPFDPKLAATYRQSAERAFAWAEQDFARDKAAGLTEKRDSTWGALDTRNLAALELYRLTKDAKYHAHFLENSALKDAKPDLFAWGKHVQRDAAFLYARLPKGLGQAEMKRKAVAGLEEMANRALSFAANNAFNVTTPDKGKPQFIGYYSTVDATDLTRAHFLTGQRKYLAGAIAATQFQSGANPSNLVYISGLGANPVRNVFKLDARRTGQAVPAGLVPYGNIDFAKWTGEYISWPITWVLGKDTVPNAYSWPLHEAYWDVGGWPMLEEFTVDTWAPNIQVWGYLAARAAVK